jgi:hypothetical protein
MKKKKKKEAHKKRQRRDGNVLPSSCYSSLGLMSATPKYLSALYLSLMARSGGTPGPVINPSGLAAMRT